MYTIRSAAMHVRSRFQRRSIARLFRWKWFVRRKKKKLSNFTCKLKISQFLFSNPSSIECSTYGNPCAYGAQCVNQKGGYKCVCPNGMAGDPYKEGCILDRTKEPSQCRSNSDCSDTLACVQGTCISPCKSLLCGQNAYCEPENHAAWCRCRVGFVENESGECVSRMFYSIF